MSTELKFTYQQFKDYERFPSNIKLAISEFIDNSISSFQNRDINNPVNGLNIKIIFDWMDENNRKIIIIDNANGMSPEIMEESMQPGGKRYEKSDNGLNQFGLGMKHGAFFIGKDVCIYSKEKGCEEYKLEVSTSKKDYNDVVIVEAVKSEDNKITSKSGTVIIISHVYNNDDKDILSRKSKFNSLKNSLSMRYGKLIESGMNIKLEILNREESTKKWPKYNEKEDKIKTSDEYGNIVNYKFSYLKKNKLIHDKKQEIQEQKISKFKDIQKRIGKIILNNNKPLLNEAYNKFIREEELSFKKVININGHKCELNFGIFSNDINNKQNYSGLTIYHANRAIIHGPNYDNNNNVINFVEDIKATNNLTARWLFGTLDLTNIESPDTNKRDFSWTVEGKEDLTKELKNIYEELKDLIQGIVEIKEIKNQKGKKEEMEQGAKDFSEKTGNDYIYEDNNDDGYNIIFDKFFIDGEKYSILLRETEDTRSFVESYLEDNKIKITVSSNNKFWNDPSLSNKGIRGKIEFPFSVFIGVMNILWTNNELKEKYKNEDLSSLFKKIVYEGKI